MECTNLSFCLLLHYTTFHLKNQVFFGKRPWGEEIIRPWEEASQMRKRMRRLASVVFALRLNTAIFACKAGKNRKFRASKKPTVGFFAQRLHEQPPKPTPSQELSHRTPSKVKADFGGSVEDLGKGQTSLEEVHPFPNPTPSRTFPPRSVQNESRCYSLFWTECGGKFFSGWVLV